LVRRLEALATLLEPTRRKLYRYVADHLTAVSRDEAARAVRTSRAMAAFHLDKLVEAGLLRAHYRHLSRRPGLGAGRPSKLYRRSRRRFDVLLPKRDHELLALLLTQSITSSPDGLPTEEVAPRYGRSLGLRARKRIPGRVTPQRLARCVADVLEEVGFEPIGAGTDEITTRNCPFDPLSRQFPDVVCQTSLALVAGVIDGIGAATLEVGREERPDRCCVVLKQRSLATTAREVSA
jgi:predicted ArsR family transcriptional regulator